MTRDEALAFLHAHEDHTQNLSTGECFNSACAEAKAVLRGYEQGIRNAADVADTILRQIETDTGYRDNFQGEAVTTTRNKILALLDAKEKKA